ncbi:MAG: hypothetical protein NVV60_02035 [Luteimonas sp.]|nr:hypothetical protein [Luteimonas sp.]
MTVEFVATQVDTPIEAADEVIQIHHQWREPDAFERIALRLRGLQTIAMLASISDDAEGLTDKAWQPFLGFVEVLADDIHRDAELLWRQRHKGARP